MLSASMTLGENIERLRHAAGLHNAAAFARDIGVSPGNLGDWEKGRYVDLRLSNLLRIAKKLKVSVDELLAGIDAEYEVIRLDPTCHPSLAGWSLQRGSADVPASARARLQQLERENEAFKTRFREVQTVTRHLFRIAIGRETPAARKRKS